MLLSDDRNQQTDEQVQSHSDCPKLLAAPNWFLNCLFYLWLIEKSELRRSCQALGHKIQGRFNRLVIIRLFYQLVIVVRNHFNVFLLWLGFRVPLSGYFVADYGISFTEKQQVGVIDLVGEPQYSALITVDACRHTSREQRKRFTVCDKLPDVYLVSTQSVQRPRIDKKLSFLQFCYYRGYQFLKNIFLNVVAKQRRQIYHAR